MKAALSPSASAALILKLVGGLMILGSIVDGLILLIPPNFLDQEWLTTLIREWILRGTIPLMGLALVLLGSWIDTPLGAIVSDRPVSQKKAQKKPQKKSAEPRWLSGITFLALCASILFTLLVPLYFNSSRLASAAATRQVNEQAAQAEQELNDRLSERREQISLLLSDPARRQALEAQLQDASGDNPLQNQFSPEQQTELRQLLNLTQRVQKDSSVLEQELTQARQAGIEQIQTQQQQARDRITGETRKLRIHTILTALVLAIGYGVIAWTGTSTAQQRQVRPRAQA